MLDLDDELAIRLLGKDIIQEFKLIREVIGFVPDDEHPLLSAEDYIARIKQGNTVPSAQNK